MLRHHTDAGVLVRFGSTSAARQSGRAPWPGRSCGPARCGCCSALLLLFVAGGELAGWTRRMRFDGRWAWVAGAASGLFGGLVGNQGGLRAAAMLGFELPKAAFVATATAIALVVDAARMPVYAWTDGARLAADRAAHRPGHRRRGRSARWPATACWPPFPSACSAASWQCCCSRSGCGDHRIAAATPMAVLAVIAA